jgi:hypothetical protein
MWHEFRGSLCHIKRCSAEEVINPFGPIRRQSIVVTPQILVGWFEMLIFRVWGAERWESAQTG